MLPLYIILVVMVVRYYCSGSQLAPHRMPAILFMTLSCLIQEMLMWSMWLAQVWWAEETQMREAQEELEEDAARGVSVDQGQIRVPQMVEGIEVPHHQYRKWEGGEVMLQFLDSGCSTRVVTYCHCKSAPLETYSGSGHLLITTRPSGKPELSVHELLSEGKENLSTTSLLAILPDDVITSEARMGKGLDHQPRVFKNLTPVFTLRKKEAVVRRGLVVSTGHRGTVEPCVLWGPRGLQAHGFESWPRCECRLGFLTQGNGFLPGNTTETARETSASGKESPRRLHAMAPKYGSRCGPRMRGASPMELEVYKMREMTKLEEDAGNNVCLLAHIVTNYPPTPLLF
ncbi:hypothetical protein E2C01_008707 [Portunus trituberculatus]|uniref:Uncharacterized protein n=1 Tax=Portunus trituberculatus TaxID=210409 RepID=A0A5B7D2J0_PORTR|nr:hypothetical protein [Portunus trituberculatus]